MFGLVVRILLALAGSIATWFVAKDALNFSTVQMTVAVLLFVAGVGILAFWPSQWFSRSGRRRPADSP